MVSKLKLNKSLKLAFKILLSTVLILIISLTVLILGIYNNHSSIKKLIINELNKSLQTEISVKDITFSVFENFPNVSFNFKGIIAKDATKEIKKGNLLVADNISIEFNLWDIYNKKYIIKKINVKRAKILLKVDSQGNDNFHFWKSDKNISKKQLSFNLKNISFNNTELIYVNSAIHQYYNINLINVKARFYSAENLNKFKLSGNILLNKFQSEDIVYFSNRNVNLSIKASIDENLKNIRIEKSSFDFDKSAFIIEGNIGYGKKNQIVDISFKGKNIRLIQILDNLPENLKTNLSQYKSKGIFDINIKIDGLYGGLNIPDVNASFKLNDGEFYYPGNKVKMANIQLEGNFNNGKKSNSRKNQLNISKISGKIDNSLFYGSFSITDFSNPLLNSNINGRINLNDLYIFLGNNPFKSLSGLIDINIQYGGLLNQTALKAETIIKSNTSGSIELKDVSFQLKNDEKRFENINSSLTFKNNNLQINKLIGKINSSDIDIKGYIENLIPFLLLNNQNLSINAELISKKLILDDLLTKVSGEKHFVFSFNPKINANLKLNFENFAFQGFNANNLSGKLTSSNNTLLFENLQMNTLGGKINGNLFIDGQLQSKLLITCDVNTESVNTKKLFTVFNNFGQKSLTHENIDGDLTSNIQFAAYFSPELNIDKKSIWSKIQLKIENGKLTEYKPLQKLSKYVNEEDLKNVSFKTIENSIFINDEVVYIPSMEIKSSALNLSISGKHQFNNQIEYRVNILLSELLSKKRKMRKQQRIKQQEEFGYEEDDGLGRTKIFIKITGTIDNPIFSYDTKSLKEKIFNDLKIEKSNLKNILKEEFKWTKKDSSDILFEQRLRQQGKGKFVIDWDETKTETNKIKKNDTIIPSGVKVKWDED
jgi:hypothetical protein